MIDWFLLRSDFNGDACRRHVWHLRCAGPVLLSGHCRSRCLQRSRLDCHLHHPLQQDQQALGISVQEAEVPHTREAISRVRAEEPDGRRFIRPMLVQRNDPLLDTSLTLRLFEERFYPSFRDNVGIVLQSYLYRTSTDTERATDIRCRVRLCKDRKSVV